MSGKQLEIWGVVKAEDINVSAIHIQMVLSSPMESVKMEKGRGPARAPGTAATRDWAYKKPAHGANMEIEGEWGKRIAIETKDKNLSGQGKVESGSTAYLEPKEEHRE